MFFVNKNERFQPPGITAGLEKKDCLWTGCDNKEAQDCLDTDTPIPMLRLIAKLEEDNLSGLYMGAKATRHKIKQADSAKLSACFPNYSTVFKG